MAPARAPVLALLALLAAAAASARTVNISNAWFLPQEGYPVFYRYFRDRITWFEADAVCQFHHANLVTVETSAQFDATRAYLRELDVTNNVWIGLKRNGPNEPFLWPNYSAVDPSASAPGGGSWLEQAASGGGPQCAASDPAADFRWHSLPCGGPAVASFICELPVPAWARAEDGCLLTSLPSLTVTFLPEQGAVELAADCGLQGSRRVACRGQASREEMERQLACDQDATTAPPTASGTMATSTTPAALTTTTVAATAESAPASTAETEQTATPGAGAQRDTPGADASSPTAASTEAPPDATEAYYDSSVSSVTATSGAADAAATSGYAEASTPAAGEQRPGADFPEATPDAGGGGGQPASPRLTTPSAATQAAAGVAEAAPASTRSRTARPGSTPPSAAGAEAGADPLQYEPEAPPPHGGRKRRLQRPQERAGSVYPYLLRVLG